MLVFFFSGRILWDSNFKKGFFQFETIPGVKPCQDGNSVVIKFLISRFSSTSRSSQSVSTWVLILRSVVLSDAGWYECQVSSTPKLSRWVQLEVVVPEVKIKGPEDMFVTAGSDVVIECVTENVISKPGLVTWVFNGKVSFFILG